MTGHYALGTAGESGRSERAPPSPEGESRIPNEGACAVLDLARATTAGYNLPWRTGAQAFRFVIGDTGATPLHPARPEFALALTIGFVRESTGEEIAPLEVCLARPAPRDASEHDRFFRTRVRFDAESNSMIVSAADASRPLRTADAALSSIVRRRLDKALAELDRRDSTGRLSNRVRDIIAGNLGKTPLTVETLAAMMAMSRRTLSRRLADEGTSFRSIVDDVRLEFARALLRDPSLSVGEIAFFLQYSEPAAFNRSFRRWTGRTPRAYRNA